MLRKGAMTSLVATELGFVGFLWVIWLGECFRVFGMSSLVVLIHPIFSSVRRQRYCRPLWLQPW